jgi:hypothetical protein
LARPVISSSSSRFEQARATIRTIERVPPPGGESRNHAVVHGWFPIDVLRLEGGPVFEGEDEDLAAAAADRAIVSDTRVRDALRTLASATPLAAGQTAYESWATPLSFPFRERAEEAALIGELQPAIAAEPPMCIDARVLALDRRVRVLENGVMGKLCERVPGVRARFVRSAGAG